MKPAAHLIVNASQRHALERALGDVQQLRIARGLVALEQQIHGARVRKFRRVAEAAVRLVKLLERRIDHRVNHARVENSARAMKHFRFGDGFGERVRGVVHLRAARLERL